MGSRWIKGLLLALLWVLAAAFPSRAQQGSSPSVSSTVPPVVSAVEVRSELSRKELPDLPSLLALSPGESMTEEAVRRTLRNLQANGRVAEAAIYSRPAPGKEGVVAVVVVWANLLVKRVELEGDLGLLERRLRSSVRQPVGQPLSESRLLQGLYRLQDQLEESGYLSAQVRLEVERRPEMHQAVVRYLVAAGPRAVVGSIRFEGDLGSFREDQLALPLEASTGDPFDERTVMEDPERLRRWLVRQDYRAARVNLAAREPSPGGERVALTYAVEAGPRVAVEVRGAELEELRKKGLLPFLDEDGYDSALLIRSRSRLVAYFQGKGYYQVRVELREETPAPGQLKVVVEVEPGPELRLQEVRFVGNETVSARQLAALISTRPHSSLRPGGGRLVSRVLEEDLDNLRAFYALQGFRQAVVEEPVIEVHGRDLRLEIHLDEGPRRQLASLGVVGEVTVPIQDWLASTALSVGGPYHPRLQEEAVNSLHARYRAEGFDWVQIEPLVVIVHDDLVDLTLRITEGERMLMDRLVIRGNLATRPRVIQRLVELEPGGPVSRSRLLEAERRLARLGIFSRADVELSPGEIGGNARDVVVRVEEGRARRVSYGFGYDSDDGVRGLLGFSHANLWGRAVSLRLNARASEKDSRFQLVLRQPYLGRWDIPVSYSLFSFDGRRESFEQRSVGVRIDGRKRFSRGSSFGLAFDFRRVGLENVEELIRVDPQDREVKISSVIPSLLVDRRDDPFDPTEGWSSALNLQYAFPVFSTDADFLKVFFQQSGYLNLGSAGVLAASFRTGAIEPLAGRITEDPATGTADNPVPIGERFFAGGRTSHRAFSRDLLGIDGKTRIARLDDEGRVVELLPGGGNGLLLVSLEYRFPLIGSLGGTVFGDAGNVWLDWRDVDVDEIRYGLGVGLRYRSPIGPVRLEVGWNLDTLPGEGSTEIHLNFGNPF